MNNFRLIVQPIILFNLIKPRSSPFKVCCLFDEVLLSVEEDDVWIADRNFCTLKFLFGVAAGQGYFMIRWHF